MTINVFLRLSHLVAGFALLAVSSANAQEFDSAQACLDTHIAENAPVAECVQQAQSVCFSYDAPSLAGADCYRRAKDHWGELIAERMDMIRAKANPEVLAIAGIEVKYDLKGNLMQCDRMEELSLVQNDPSEETVFTRMRCEATAVGLAFAKLYFQSQSIK